MLDAVNPHLPDPASPPDTGTLRGDRAPAEPSPSDLTRGRITYHHK